MQRVQNGGKHDGNGRVGWQPFNETVKGGNARLPADAVEAELRTGPAYYGMFNAHMLDDQGQSLKKKEGEALSKFHWESTMCALVYTLLYMMMMMMILSLA